MSKRTYSVPPGWHDQASAAVALGVTVATIRRRHKQGLAFYRVGGRALYRDQDLDAWLEARRVGPAHFAPGRA
jgi:excisionase family DNA binding protein